MGKLALIWTLAVAALAGCGGDTEGSFPNGIYEQDISEQYLLDNGIPDEQAANESGLIELTMQNGSMTLRDRAKDGTDIVCTATYEQEGGHVTFTWISGCFGDYAATYAVDGDTVTWSDVEVLEPHDSADDLHTAEVFNAVPWTRTGDTPDQ